MYPKVTFSNIFLLSILAALILHKQSPQSASPSSFLSLFTATLSITTSVRVIWLLIIYPKYCSPLLHFPGPPVSTTLPSPITSISRKSPDTNSKQNASFFMGNCFPILKAGLGDVLRAWVDEVPNEGIIRYLDYFNGERLAVVGPIALAEVLVHKSYDFEKPALLRKGVSVALGMGLFLAEGENHKRQKKLLTPAFAYRHVRNLYPVFWDKSTELVRALRATVKMPSEPNLEETGVLEVNEWARRATLDVIGQGGFGHAFDAINNPRNELARTYHRMFTPGRTGKILVVMGFLLPPWIVRRLPWLRNTKTKRAATTIRSYCHSLLDLKRRQQQRDEITGNAAAPAAGIDILTVAIASNAFTDEELVDQMMTFLAAGHETTASALTWAVYLLAKHPEMQRRLRDEVHASQLPSFLEAPPPSPISSANCPVTAETIDQMPYLDAFCRETLRLFPPVALTIRTAIKDTDICGHLIPKGTTLILPPWAVNTSRKLWGPDAGEFNPERWTTMRTATGANDVDDDDDDDDSNSVGGKRGVQKGNNFAMLTFLHGPRSCIGQSFAMGELKCLLAAWVGAFETVLADDGFVPVVRGLMTAKPKDGLHVRLRAWGG